MQEQRVLCCVQCNVLEGCADFLLRTVAVAVAVAVAVYCLQTIPRNDLLPPKDQLPSWQMCFTLASTIFFPPLPQFLCTFHTKNLYSKQQTTHSNCPAFGHHTFPTKVQ